MFTDTHHPIWGQMNLKFRVISVMRAKYYFYFVLIHHKNIYCFNLFIIVWNKNIFCCHADSTLSRNCYLNKTKTWIINLGKLHTNLAYIGIFWTPPKWSLECVVHALTTSVWWFHSTSGDLCTRSTMEFLVFRFKVKGVWKLLYVTVLPGSFSSEI